MQGISKRNTFSKKVFYPLHFLQIIHSEESDHSRPSPSPHHPHTHYTYHYSSFLSIFSSIKPQTGPSSAMIYGDCRTRDSCNMRPAGSSVGADPYKSRRPRGHPGVGGYMAITLFTIGNQWRRPTWQVRSLLLLIYHSSLLNYMQTCMCVLPTLRACHQKGATTTRQPIRGHRTLFAIFRTGRILLKSPIIYS